MIMEELIKALYQLVCQQSDQVNKTLELLTKQGLDPLNINAGVKPVNFSAIGKSGRLLDSNMNRQGFIVHNDSTAILYICMDPNNCSADYFSIPIDAGATEYYIPANGAYKGAITYYALDATGRAMVTELSYEK